MKKTVATAAAAAALTTGGVALANGGGPTGGVLGIGDDPQHEFASDLAAELGGGITADEVRAALEAVREEDEAERREELATALAAELEGVSAEQIEAALAKQEESMREAFEAGEGPPAPGSFFGGLAADLGVSEAELEDAFAAVHEKMADGRPELGFRTNGAGPPPGGPGFEVHVAPGPGLAGPGFGPGFGERS